MSRVYDQFVTILGDIKLFKFPFWLVYDPGSYRIKGPEMRAIQSGVRPGDVFLRRYDNYLDSRIITGVFSHAALFLGEVTESDEVETPEGANRAMSFSVGPAQIAHSTAEGVHLEDILTFLQCDGVAILRFPEILHRLASPPPPPPDFETWHDDEKAVHRRLESGLDVPFSEVVPIVRDLALGQLGTPYDFSFDFENGNRLSCTEFVAHCYRCLQPVHGIAPKRQSFLGGLRHEVVIRPDDFLKSPQLDRIHVTPGIEDLVNRTVRA
jgi:hypothetical protein